ncbi:MAG: hypothetical protein KatS3mg108_1511 [Isosphaeraceae bacterium]|jgi:hypothetical protein|nr:MAG: hypothetical protein KatS3mg108_1511 [Isosphaeraceae bacterium]
MHEPRGRTLRLSEPRRFIGDLAHFARRVPSVPVARTFDLGPLLQARAHHPIRPSWAVLFMKAYACVAADHPPLRRCLLSFPTNRLYEHPISTCALALERDFEGEPGIFVGLFRAPDQQSLAELDAALRCFKHDPIESIGFFRQELRVCRAPLPIRRLLWWSTLNLSGVKRAKRFGTFGLSSYGALGAEQLHPISPLTTTLTYGPIDSNGYVCVKLIYDHRVLDGAYVARRLADLEHTLKTTILAELRSSAAQTISPAA